MKELIAAKADVGVTAKAGEFAGKDALRIGSGKSSQVAAVLLEAKATPFAGFEVFSNSLGDGFLPTVSSNEFSVVFGCSRMDSIAAASTRIAATLLASAPCISRPSTAILLR